MTNADWWARVVEGAHGTERHDLRPERVVGAPQGPHEPAIDLRPVPGVGAEIVLSVDGEIRRSRLFRSYKQAELVGAIADARATFETRGWA